MAQTGRVQQDYWVRPLTWEIFFGTFNEFILPMPDYDQLPNGWIAFAAFAASCLVVSWKAGGATDSCWRSRSCRWSSRRLVSTITPVWVGRYFRFTHLFVLATVALAVWRLSERRRLLRLGIGLGAVRRPTRRELRVLERRSTCGEGPGRQGGRGVHPRRAEAGRDHRRARPHAVFPREVLRRPAGRRSGWSSPRSTSSGAGICPPRRPDLDRAARRRAAPRRLADRHAADARHHAGASPRRGECDREFTYYNHLHARVYVHHYQRRGGNDTMTSLVESTSIPGLHADRAARRHRDHRRPDRAAPAGRAGGAGGGAAGPMPGQPAAARDRAGQLRVCRECLSVRRRGRRRQGSSRRSPRRRIAATRCTRSSCPIIEQAAALQPAQLLRAAVRPRPDRRPQRRDRRRPERDGGADRRSTSSSARPTSTGCRRGPGGRRTTARATAHRGRAGRATACSASPRGSGPADIRDGLSNTAAMSERVRGHDDYPNARRRRRPVPQRRPLDRGHLPRLVPGAHRRRGLRPAAQPGRGELGDELARRKHDLDALQPPAAARVQVVRQRPDLGRRRHDRQQPPRQGRRRSSSATGPSGPSAIRSTRASGGASGRSRAAK